MQMNQNLKHDNKNLISKNEQNTYMHICIYIHDSNESKPDKCHKSAKLYKVMYV